MEVRLESPDMHSFRALFPVLYYTRTSGIPSLWLFLRGPCGGCPCNKSKYYLASILGPLILETPYEIGIPRSHHEEGAQYG